MNCIASTYNASGKLVGCDEQDLNAIISVQLYTVFALGTGLYVCRSFTADNWADLALTIGWGCISAFTRTKRAFTKYVLPCIAVCSNWAWINLTKDEYDEQTDDDDEEDDDVSHSCIRVVKNGGETVYSSVFSFVQDLDERFTNGDVVNVELSDADNAVADNAVADNAVADNAVADNAVADNAVADNTVADNAVAGNAVAGNAVAGNAVADNEDNDNAVADNGANEDDAADISELIHRIGTHTMQFDFVLSAVPTLQTIVNALNGRATAKSEGVHVMKYDGFPLDPIDGVHFYDRKFVPVDHRMMEIVLRHEGSEYDLNLASPDNFYVAGNKLLDFAFLKWFMLKNHGVQLAKREYVIKCVDHAAVLHTLHPDNYLHVSVAGFEVRDSGVV
jgi:hypothetical protein